MSFSERLNLIFDEIGCSNTDVAKLARIHPSGISRFRNGERTPTPRSNQVRSLCTGIVEYSDSMGKTRALCQVCGVDNGVSTSISKEDLSSHLLMWLLEDSFSFKFFSDKLNIIMNELDISNSALAAAIHVDASVISRFRNNVRVPSNYTILNAISTFVIDTAIRNKKIDALTSITNIPIYITENNEPMTDGEPSADHRGKSIDYIMEWFSGGGESAEHKIVASFLGKIDKFTPGAFPELPDLDLIAPEIIRNDKADCYIGIDGLRKAVVRFLGNAAVSDSPNTLLLYSDQSMDWMTADPEYRKVWAALMVYTLRAKNRIRIIHNIDRDTAEMVKAIEGWLPLYMSGFLEAYIHKKNVGERFAHTLFISPGQNSQNGNARKEAVIASFPVGMEDSAEYNYYTGNKIDYYIRQHEALVTSSVPIMRMFSPGDTDGLMLIQRELAEAKGEQCRLLNAPSVETMSEKTLARILDRLAPSDDVRQKIQKHCAKKRELYELAVNAGTIKEYIYSQKGELYNHSNISNSNESNEWGQIPINLGDLFLGEQWYYTEDEYNDHIEDMKRLERLNTNYSFKLLRERYFENLQIISKKDSGALVIKADKISDVSSYWHPIMANVYHNYLNELVSGKVSDVHGWE